jgi:glycosyltransferase involved in cell wall biosynthesis
VTQVSIVTTSYNQAQFLDETIRSVLEQDYDPLEYIVVDDGSTDGSLGIAQRYADRLTLITQENRGQAAALNVGFERARGELLGFLSSDDMLLPGAVGRLAAEFDRNPDLLLAYGGAILVDQHSRHIRPHPARPWDIAVMAGTGRQAVPQPASLWSRQAWEIAGPFNERAWALFDTEFYLQLAAAGPAARVAEPLALVRLHPQAKSHSRHSLMAAECRRFADDFFGSRRLPEPLRPFARAGRANFYRRAALAYQAAGEIEAARWMFLKSLVLTPRGMNKKQLRRLLRTFLPRSDRV